MPDTALLVDKDQGHSNALARYLERQRFEVDTCAEFDELLVLIDHLAPEYIIADPGLPHTEMIELLAQVKKTSPRTQIIITVLKKDLDKAVELLGANCHHYLEKPVKSNLLDLALKEAREKIGLLHRLGHYERRLTAMETAENLYRQLFDEVPCYISVQDDQFRITASNTLFKSNFGSQIGTYCYEIYKQRTTPCEKCPVAATFKDGLSHQTEEIVTSKDGKQYNVLTFTAPIKDEGGKITQVMECRPTLPRSGSFRTTLPLWD
jgi:ActR/RegA family two-component response regulator